MSYLRKILHGLPEEIQCVVHGYLIDLQQDVARNLSRKDSNSFLRKIKHPDGLRSCLIKTDFTRPTNIREYHLMMYSIHSDYRSQILSQLPGGKLPECDGRRWFGRMKLIEDATIAWNVMKRQGDIEYIEYRYNNYRNKIADIALGNGM